MPRHGWYPEGTRMPDPKMTGVDNKADTQDDSEDTEQVEEVSE